jgi:hypothetical protein
MASSSEMSEHRLGSLVTRTPVFTVALAAAALAAGVEMIFLANLQSRPLFLAVVVLTTVVGLALIGLTVSRIRSRLSRVHRVAIGTALWSLVAVDVALMVVAPFAVGPPPALDKPVRFAQTALPTSGPASTQTAAAAPALPAPRTGAFNNQGPEPVSGRATLGHTADGKLVLRLADLNSTPGPNLWVYLSRADSPSTDAQVKDGLELGQLRATRGDLNYDVDPSVDPTQFQSAVVYCKTFRVVFGFANLK